MTLEPPTSPKEALQQATLEIGNLRRQLPGAKAGDVLAVFDRIDDLWAKQDLEQVPFVLFRQFIDTVKTEVREAYGDGLNLPVDRTSPVFGRVIELDCRAQIYSDAMVLGAMLDGLEKRLRRIEEVLPSRNYALRDLFREVRPSLPENLEKRIETAFTRFEREEYESTVSECGMAEGILFSLFRDYLKGLGIDELPNDIGPAIGRFRKIAESRRDSEGLSLSKSGRLELLMLSMFELLHYLRNLGHHESAEEAARDELPTWQVRRRAILRQRPEYARLALVLALQIAS